MFLLIGDIKRAGALVYSIGRTKVTKMSILCPDGRHKYERIFQSDLMVFRTKEMFSEISNPAQLVEFITKPLWEKSIF